MNNKRLLENEIMELRCVIEHFKKNNQVVIERYTIRYGLSYEMVVSEINNKIEFYNRRYGKRFGQKSLCKI
jgi:hypothetical protein